MHINGFCVPRNSSSFVHVAEDVRYSIRCRGLNDWYNVKGLFADRAGAPRNVIYVGSHRSGCRTCHRDSRETSKHCPPLSPLLLFLIEYYIS